MGFEFGFVSGMMYLVYREGTWESPEQMAAQPYWQEHASFMNALADSGFVQFGGPYGHDGRSILLVVEAESEVDILERLSSDVWEVKGILKTTEIAPWWIALRSGT